MTKNDVRMTLRKLSREDILTIRASTATNKALAEKI
jgi:hypothetical protein